MNSTISFGYPWWLLFPCLVLGGLYAFFLYRNETHFSAENNSKWFQRILILCRFLAGSLLAILLLSVFWKSKNTTTYKPIVAILQDNSESILHKLSKQDSLQYAKKMEELKVKLQEKFDVQNFTFGSAFQKNDKPNFTEKSTNLSDAFEQIEDVFYNQNLGGVVVASDGIFNQGVNPIYTCEKSNYSIYSVALGDTTISKDLKFGNAYYNKITYLNDQFSLKIDVAATNLMAQNATLSITEISENGATQISNKSISINSQNFAQSFDFLLNANKIGIIHYRLTFSNLNGEATFKNNVKDIFVEVLDGRQKILLVANSPHPDIAALKQTIEKNKNYQLEIQYADNYTAKLNDYNLIILHQLPSLTNKIANILTEAKSQKKSLLFVLGTQTSTTDLTASQTGISMAGNANQLNDVSAKVNAEFTPFSLSENTKQALLRFPPLTNFFGNYKSGGASQTLLYQRINNVETDFPLWLFADQSDNKMGVICGEGIWRWRLYDFLQNKNQDAFNEIINKTIQYLAVKTDKRPFRVITDKNIFADNEQILFDAQLYNANFELTNTPEVDFKLKNEEGKEFNYKFSKTENHYSLNVGFLPVGNYKYWANTKLGNNVYKAEGKLSVAPLQLEEMRTVADHRTLFQLANAHQGKLYYPSNFEKIAEDLLVKNKLKPVLYDSFLTESAINLKSLLGLLILILAVEWFLRKYLGSY